MEGVQILTADEIKRGLECCSMSVDKAECGGCGKVFSDKEMRESNEM